MTSVLLRLVIVAPRRRALRILRKSRWFEPLSRFDWVEPPRWWHRNQRMLRKTKRKKHHSPDLLELGTNHMLKMYFWKVARQLCHSQKNKDCWWRLQGPLSSSESRWVRH